MPESLSKLESLRGKPSRTFIAGADSPRPHEVAVRWSCGCFASGPSFRQLELQPSICRLHRPQQSIETRRIKLPDPQTLKRSV
jgi:hypothetical protein